MNYLLFICAGGEPGAPATESGAPANVPTLTIDEWVRDSEERGLRVLGRPLDPPDTAVTVRVRDGATLVTDGPFTESKEFVAGFDLLTCADLDEALPVAAAHPMARVGAAELRPFHDGLRIDDAVRDWGATEPPDSWVLFCCVNGISEGDGVEARVARESDEWARRLRERGVLVFGHPLGHADTATTVRVRAGETLLSDGPFVETKEFIGGVIVLRGVSRDQAIEAAAEHPVAGFHRIEVRRFRQE